MATLLTTAGNGTGSGASHSGDATVYAYGTFDGATLVVQVSPDDTNYVKADNITPGRPARMTSPGAVTIGGKGTYYIRCVVKGGGDNVSISSVSTQ